MAHVADEPGGGHFIWAPTQSPSFNAKIENALSERYEAWARRMLDSGYGGWSINSVYKPLMEETKMTWKTKDGREILIAEMTDGHLKNATNYLLRRLEALKTEVNKELSPFERALYTPDYIYDERDLRKKIEYAQLRLAYLFYEALIRGFGEEMNEWRQQLVEILNRSNRINTPQIADKAYEFEDADYDNDEEEY